MVTDRRSQLILVTAVLVALTVLASVVLLNAIHIPADLTTGSLNEDVDRVHQLDASVREDLDRVFEVSTNPGDPTLAGTQMPFVVDETAFEAAVNDSMAIRRNLTASQSGTAISVVYRGSASQTGVAVFQADTDRVTDENGNSSWVAMNGASRLNLRAHVTNHSGIGNATLYVENGGNRWTLNISTNGVYTTDAGQLCSAGEMPNFADGSLRVSVSRGHGTVWADTSDGTTRCGDFTFGDGVGTPYTVGFAGGNRMNATYGIAGQGVPQVSSTYPGGSQPWRTSGVVVNPAFDVTYVTDGITYQSSYALYNGTGQ